MDDSNPAPSDRPASPPDAPAEAHDGATAAVDGRPVYPIADADLARDDLPDPRDPFDAVVRFAYTFDGYAHFGMEMCAGIGNRAVSQFLELGRLPDWIVGDLSRLRGALYFEVRRWILLEREPNPRVLLYVHALIDAVRDAIRNRERD